MQSVSVCCARRVPLGKVCAAAKQNTAHETPNQRTTPHRINRAQRHPPTQARAAFDPALGLFVPTDADHPHPHHAPGHGADAAASTAAAPTAAAAAAGGAHRLVWFAPAAPLAPDCDGDGAPDCGAPDCHGGGYSGALCLEYELLGTLVGEWPARLVCVWKGWRQVWRAARQRALLRSKHP